MKEGWKKVKFSSLFNDPKKAIISGPFGSNLKSSEYQIEGVPLVRLQNVDRYRFINKNIIYITTEKAKELSSHSYRAGDILITKLGAPLGKACIAPEISGEGIILADIVRIRLDNSLVDRDFIVYQLNSGVISDQLKELTTGATRPRVTLKNMRELNFILPPLFEQEQIVSVLKESFAAIDQAKANIEKNIENAKEVFQSKLNTIFSQKGKGWEKKTLGEVYDVRDGTHDSPKYQEKGFPLITSKNLKNGNLDFSKIKYISKVDLEAINKRSKVDRGDVLFAMIGTIGNPVVIKEEPNYAIKNVALFKVDSAQDGNFLRYYLESKIAMEKMLKDAKGTTQKFVGLGYLRSFPISIPELHVQQSLVEKIDKLKFEVEAITSCYRQKVANLENLRESILQKAFAGELTQKEIEV